MKGYGMITWALAWVRLSLAAIASAATVTVDNDGSTPYPTRSAARVATRHGHTMDALAWVSRENILIVTALSRVGEASEVAVADRIGQVAGGRDVPDRVSDIRLIQSRSVAGLTAVAVPLLF